MAYRRNARIAADEYCSAIELNRLFRMEGSIVLPMFLGCDERDDRWIAPDGRDLTDLCNRSDYCFDSHEWRTDGWVLTEKSMARLRAEFPHEFVNRDEVANR